jgi:hypothetical protein
VGVLYPRVCLSALRQSSGVHGRIAIVFLMRFPKPAKRSPKPRKRVKRSVRPHAVRQTKRAAQERKLDRLWSAHVLGRDRNCQLCGLKPATDAHHIFGRTKKSTRWEVDNGVGLDRICHGLAHEFAEPFHVWAAERLGENRYIQLFTQSRWSGRVNLDQAARELAG